MNKKIQKAISSVYGKMCCRVSIGSPKSLALGFGERIYHANPRLNDTFYGEWEIGTYYGSWRIVKNSKIILGSGDDVGKLKKEIKDIQFQPILSITNLSSLDVRVEFSDGLAVDFLPTFSGEDEAFHMFCPEHIYIEFTSDGSWKIGQSNTPWSK